MWFPKICEGQHEVEPYLSEHSPPSRRLHHWGHHQRKVLLAHFQIHNDRFPCRVSKSSPNNLTGPLGTPTNAPVEEVIAVPERETVSQVMAAPGRQEEVKHLSHRNERKSRLGTCSKESLLSDRYTCRETSELTDRLDWPSWKLPLTRHSSKMSLPCPSGTRSPK